jgi:hypothetical protein
MKFFASSAFVLVTIAAARIAVAQPAMTPKDAAQESYAKGQKLANLAAARHDPALYEAAYLQFAQAHAIYPDDKVLWNLAASEVYTQRYVEALEHFRVYDEHQHVLEHSEHPDHARLTAFIAQAWNATGHLQIDAPEGAEIQVDGKVVGVAPLAASINVVPGAHAINARLPGVQPLHGDVDVAAGTVARVGLALGALPAPQAVPVAAPQAPQVSEPSFHYESSGAKVATLVALGVGAAALLGAGIGFEAASSSALNDLNADHAQIQRAGGNSMYFCTTNPTAAPCSDESTRAGAHASDGNVATGMFVGGGVLAVAAVVTWVVWPKKKVEDGAWVVPIVSPRTAGLGLACSF